MGKPSQTAAECVLLGDFIDEAEIPQGVRFHSGVAVHARIAGEYLEDIHSPVDTQSLGDILADVLQQQPDGPSRIQMIHAITRFQAVESLAHFLNRENQDVANQNMALQCLKQIFDSDHPRSPQG
ncbi:MAG: hypothetical protein ACRC8S_01945 [Fimbriiglobus sp.]